MADFVINNGGTIVVAAILAAVVALIIIKIVKDRKRGCGCDCAGCSKSKRACGR